MTQNPSPEAPGVAPLFPSEDAPKTQACSFNECLAGHRWAPAVVATQCPGCGAPLIAIQKVNCPYCNEPCIRTVLRSDFVPRGAGAARRCCGADVNGESLDLEMTRQQWREVQAEPDTLFEDRRASERGDANDNDSNRSTQG